MINSATLMHLEEFSLGPVSKTTICISHADREKIVSQIRATSQELRRSIFKNFSFIGKGAELTEISASDDSKPLDLRL